MEKISQNTESFTRPRTWSQGITRHMLYFVRYGVGSLLCIVASFTKHCIQGEQNVENKHVSSGLRTVRPGRHLYTHHSFPFREVWIILESSSLWIRCLKAGLWKRSRLLVTMEKSPMLILSCWIAICGPFHSLVKAATCLTCVKATYTCSYHCNSV